MRIGVYLSPVLPGGWVGGGGGGGGSEDQRSKATVDVAPCDGNPCVHAMCRYLTPCGLYSLCFLSASTASLSY